MKLIEDNEIKIKGGNNSYKKQASSFSLQWQFSK